MADNQDQQLAAFVEMTHSDPKTARAILEASNWNLENALELHYSGAVQEGTRGAHQDDEDDPNYQEAEGEPTSQPSSRMQGGGRTLGGDSIGGSSSGVVAESSSAPKRRQGGAMTLGQMNKPDPKKQDMYAGGEKSGLAVQNPRHDDEDDDDEDEDDSSGQNLIQKILQRAEAGLRSRIENPEEDEEDARPRFSGTGHTLGSDDVPSRTIEDPSASDPQRLPKVTRTLTFWKDGFSIEDGPLMRYDDPQHQDTLRAIQSGRAPLSIMNVQPGQPTDLQVYRKMDENYSPTAKKSVPFSGSGQRLGAPTPGTVGGGGGGGGGSSSASASAPPPPPASSSAPPRTVDLDSSAPTTNLQVRLGDGTRLVSRFNHTHTVGDIYAFVNASNIQSRTRSYVLQTTFPSKELNDHGNSLKDAGLINAVVVQKWT